MAIVANDQILNMWKPKGIGQDPPSTSTKPCTLTVFGTEETITLPVYTNTKVHEVKAMLANKLGIEPETMKFLHKQGARYVRENHESEEIMRNVIIKGIKSFTRVKTEYNRPHVVIGAGHLGLKTAMGWLTERPPFTNFTIIDRRPKVGGTSWWTHANVTSRLQTEVGVYHLEYHEDNGWPPDCRWNPWPSRNQLLARFMQQAEEWGILPYCQMNTNVTLLNVIGKDPATWHYELTLDRNGKESIFEAASCALFPGNLTSPKRVTYKGEETFGGDIVYGIGSQFDYPSCAGKQVAIIGSGAFSVENVRTCVEYRAQKIFMICRRKSLAMPRVVSWFINQSLGSISAGLTLEAMSPMYDLIGVDQWAYYSVFPNASRTFVNIRQASRFGIGDVYFLCMYYGHVENIVDDVKRVSENRIHLNSGRVIDDVFAMLKLLGFNGEFDNDRLMRIKEMFGWWPNRDGRRFVVAEPIGVDANNFGSTSFSPGAISWTDTLRHFLAHPKDFNILVQSNALPTHVADPSKDRPAYVVEARFGSMTAVCISGLIPALAEREAVTGPLKHQRMWQMHPVDSYIAAAKKEWDEWSKTIQSMGYTKEHPPYPYTLEVLKPFRKKEWVQLNLIAPEQG